MESHHDKFDFRLLDPFPWINIPAGQTTLEDGHGIFDVPAFTISKYPVTVVQYQLFMKDDGYSTRKWWKNAGWYAKRNQEWDSSASYQDGKPWIEWTEPRYWYGEAYQDFFKPDHPIIGVSWHEALAFCGWLGEKTGDKSCCQLNSSGNVPRKGMTPESIPGVMNGIVRAAITQ